MKSLIAAVATLLTAIGAFSLQIDYTKGQTQENMGHLIMKLSKSCDK